MSRKRCRFQLGKKKQRPFGPLLEWFSTPIRLNGLFDLFIQQLWNNIGSISRKFTSFYGARRWLAQAACEAANRLVCMSNKITAAAVAAR